ncbi:hypothetical protein [Streptomyces cyaneus]|nr:hypothetical protein [Streptomyces cyaneus]
MVATSARVRARTLAQRELEFLELRAQLGTAPLRFGRPAVVQQQRQR